MEAAAWGLIGTLVGALTSIGTTWLTHRNSYLLQAARVSEERTERAKSFQRETLLELQEAIHDSLRLNTRAHFEERMACRQTGKWGDHLLTEEVNEGLRLANRRVSILVERVADEPLRAKVKTLTRLATDGRFLSSEHEAELNQQELAIETPGVFEHIGSVMRGYYEPSKP